MPYKSNSELPPAVKNNLPGEAQSLFRGAFNGFMAANPSAKEERAFAVAWAAVKRKFKQEGEKWVAKDGTEDSQPFDFEERILIDRASIVRRTEEGYLIANPRVARIGIQEYAGWEVGLPDKKVVRVYRPEEEVFKPESMASYAHRPVTNDHPREPVTSKNWKKVSAGQMDGEIARDGDYVRVPMMVMDEDAIHDVEAGKAELSAGYRSNLVWGEGKTPQGQVYDAMQTDIRINHVAIVKEARGGPMLRIGDSADNTVDKIAELIKEGKYSLSGWLPINNSGANALMSFAHDAKEYPFGENGTVYRCGLVAARDRAVADGHSVIADAASTLLQLIDQQQENGMELKSMTVDGLTVQLPDQAQQIVDRALKERDAKITTMTADIATLTKKVSDTEAAAKKDNETKDAKIVTLEQQLKDAVLTPAKLDALVKDRAEVIGKAKAVIGDKLVVDGKDITDIQRQVVAEKLGADKVKDWSADAVKASFDTLTADVKAAQNGNLGDARTVFAAPGFRADNRSEMYDKRDKALENAWKGPAAGAA